MLKLSTSVPELNSIEAEVWYLKSSSLQSLIFSFKTDPTETSSFLVLL
jgi:hypothetical protein